MNTNDNSEKNAERFEEFKQEPALLYTPHLNNSIDIIEPPFSSFKTYLTYSSNSQYKITLDDQMHGLIEIAACLDKLKHETQHLDKLFIELQLKNPIDIKDLKYLFCAIKLAKVESLSLTLSSLENPYIKILSDFLRSCSLKFFSLDASNDKLLTRTKSVLLAKALINNSTLTDVFIDESVKIEIPGILELISVFGDNLTLSNFYFSGILYDGAIPYLLKYLTQNIKVFLDTKVNEETLPILKSIRDRISFFMYKFRWEYKIWGKDYTDIRTSEYFDKENEIKQFENNSKKLNAKISSI